MSKTTKAKPKPVATEEVFNGALSRMRTAAEVKVWTVLAVHASSVYRDAWPSLERMELLTGLGRSSVCRALNSLEGKKLIQRERSSGGRRSNGKGYSSNYFVNETDDLTGGNYSGAGDTVNSGAGDTLETGSTVAQETPNSGAGALLQCPTRDIYCAAPATRIGIEQSENKKENAAAASLAAGGAAAAPLPRLYTDEEAATWDAMTEDERAAVRERLQAIRHPAAKLIQERSPGFDGPILLTIARKSRLPEGPSVPLPTPDRARSETGRVSTQTSPSIQRDKP